MTTKSEIENRSGYRKPLRTFENSGLVNPKLSYHIPFETVVNTNNQDIKTMVDDGRYFSIFAPRQSGKTTFLSGIRRQLHQDQTYIVITLSFERYSDLDKKRFYELVQEELYDQLKHRLVEVQCEKTETVEQFLNIHSLIDHISFGTLFLKLNQIIQFKKIIIFIDEFDGIPVSELGNFLTTLRDLHQKLKILEQKALYSIGLIGIRNITKLVVGGVSPFNIADQVVMPPFSIENVRNLYAQYTEESNQSFTEDAIKAVHRETNGQTWLVNRLGTILTVNVKPRTIEPIDEKDVEEAIKILLQERNDHFDNLYEKAIQYKETFVEIVFDHTEYNPYDKDQTWLEQYGLIKNSSGNAVISNNIYKMIHLKAFFKEVQPNRGAVLQDYVLPGNRLDMDKIILDFEKYITQIGVNAFYQGKKPYEKTGQFLLTAWLYQFVKGGEGELRYEIRSGLGRMDILLTHRSRKYIIETKVNRYSDISKILEEGIEQLSTKYLATESAPEAYLVIFDTKTVVGEACKVSHHKSDNKNIISFIIAIGRNK
jgi:AAA-like domain